MNKKLVLIGGGGHCEACIDVIESIGIYDIYGVLDAQEKVGSEVLGYSIIGNDSDIPGLVQEECCFLVTVGQIESHVSRKRLYDLLCFENAVIETLISPYAYVSKHANISQGTIIMHHALVNSSAKIGENCIINTKALVEHGSIIGDHCHIATSATVNGDCAIGEGVFFGSNAVCKEGIIIREQSFIKANSIVATDCK